MKKIAMLLPAVLLALSVSAETRPQWVQKGVESLNNKVTDRAYGFQSFRTVSADRNRLELERFKPLMEYVGGEYGVAVESMSLDRLAASGGRATYRISFPQAGGTSVVYAQLVDDWMHLEEGESESWGFNLHQLYAVSDRDAVPQFDNFTVSERYGVAPVLMSLVPGLGQIYKGQKVKGYTILGAEAVLVGGIIYGELERARYVRLGKEEGNATSYNSKAATFRQLRNVCIVAGSALYLYNIIDAAVAKGARRVTVQRRNNSTAEVAFAPVVTAHGEIGAGMSVRF